MNTRIGSLCTGYGGLDRAVEMTIGGELAWVADNDPGAAKILAHRFPDVPNLGDITAVDWAAVEPVNILTAGFPCTDVSCAGARAGLREGTRSGVWTYCARAIAALRPSLVVIENVRGLLSAGADSNLEPCPWCMGEAGNEHPLRASGAVLGDLADLGYDAEWVTVSAADTGAPHLRERVFILAWPAADPGSRELQRRGVTGVVGGPTAGESGERNQRERAGHAAGRGGAAAAESAGVRLPLRQPEHLGRGIRAAVAPDGRDTAQHDRITHQGSPAPEDADRTAGGERRITEPGEAESGRPWADTGRPGGTPAIADADSTLGGRHKPRSRPGALQGTAVAERAPQQPGRLHSGSGDHGAMAWGAYEPAIRRWEAALGRPAPRPTEPGRTGERLSPAFVEWLMGLPEGWVTDVPGLSRNAQLKALGNGVVPQQAAMALRSLLARTGTEMAA